MLHRVCLVLAITVLAPAFAFAQEEEKTFVRCGEQYMTLLATGGETFVRAGPLIVRKSDVRAIYVSDVETFTMWIDIGRAFLRPTIDTEALLSILECLD